MNRQFKGVIERISKNKSAPASTPAPAQSSEKTSTSLRGFSKKITLKVPLFNFTKKFSTLGVLFAMILAVPIVAVSAMEALLVLKIMQNESRAFIQQSIGDTSLILAGQFRSEFNRLIERLTAVGEAAKANLAAPQAEAAAQVKLESYEFEPAMLDFSIWGRQGQVSVFDLDQQPIRQYWATNAKYASTSEDLVKKAQEVEAQEGQLIRGVFQGRIVITAAPEGMGKSGIAILAIPLGQGVVDRVAVAHLRLDHFQDFLKKEAMVSTMLVDETGNILAHPDPKFVGQAKVADSPLFQAIAKSKLPSGQMQFNEANGQGFLGGYSRVGVAEMSVLSSISEDESASSLKAMRRQLLIFVVCCFIFFFISGYFVSTRIDVAPLLVKKQTPQKQESSQTDLIAEFAPKKVTATVLHGTLRPVNIDLDNAPLDDTLEGISDYFRIVQSCVHHYGGLLEKQAGASFLATWGLTPSDGTEVWRALRCAFEIRSNLIQFNQSRKVEGRKPLYGSLGVHTGVGLAGWVGSGSFRRPTLIGDVVSCGKALERLTAQAKTDLLISQETWQLSEGKFSGELLGEVKLTATTGITNYYSLSGYQNEEGKTVSLEGELFPADANIEGVIEGGTVTNTFIEEKKPSRWLVNNGSQILGPLAPKEIAARLFAQELDFDCECWAEGTGTSAQLKNAGIFTGAEGDSANLWAFDGEMVHGPLTLGFLNTALKHGALPQTIYLCENTTVNGWRPLKDWEAQLAAAAVAAEAPTTSTAPTENAAAPQPKTAA